MKFCKEICSASISRASAELFSHRMTSYVSQKYNTNIFDLLKCTSLDFFKLNTSKTSTDFFCYSPISQHGRKVGPSPGTPRPPGLPGPPGTPDLLGPQDLMTPRKSPLLFELHN